MNKTNRVQMNWKIIKVLKTIRIVRLFLGSNMQMQLIIKIICNMMKIYMKIKMKKDIRIEMLRLSIKMSYWYQKKLRIFYFNNYFKKIKSKL